MENLDTFLLRVASPLLELRFVVRAKDDRVKAGTTAAELDKELPATAVECRDTSLRSALKRPTEEELQVPLSSRRFHSAPTATSVATLLRSAGVDGA